MNDLISRSKLIDHLNACLAESDGGTPITDAVIVAIRCAVEQMPTVDAVPVVRCGECKKWGTGKGSFNRCQMNMDDWPKADDFCSYGERKDKT